jgi:NAD-dependent SIR2 family protein deacetylase
MNDELKTFIESHRRLFDVTGAGCGVNSGIPDYRDANGDWKRKSPVRIQAFVADEATRRRYWARSMIGWRRFGQALPNDAHHALAPVGGQRSMRDIPHPERGSAAPGCRE